jgi:dTDP-4-dehydrorhamnose 3,5-epimerase
LCELGGIVKVHPLSIPDVLLIEPLVHGDERGFFLECWNDSRYSRAGIAPGGFKQLNHSRSARGILRGLHFQLQHPQGKLVRVLSGEVLDVAVDLRPDSRSYGHWVSAILSSENHHQLWIPPGFAHGFVTQSEQADFEYLCTELYHAEDEGCIRWNDPDLAIDWGVDEPCISEKDRQALSFVEQQHLFNAHYRNLGRT